MRATATFWYEVVYVVDDIGDTRATAQDSGMLHQSQINQNFLKVVIHFSHLPHFFIVMLTKSILSWLWPPLCSWLLGPPLTVSVSSHLCAGQQRMSYSVTDMKKYLNGDLHGDFGDFVKWMNILDDLKAKEDKPDLSHGKAPTEWLWQPGGLANGAGAGARRQFYYNSLSQMHIDQHPMLGFVRSSKKVVMPVEAPPPGETAALAGAQRGAVGRRVAQRGGRAARRGGYPGQRRQ